MAGQQLDGEEHPGRHCPAAGAAADGMVEGEEGQRQPDGGVELIEMADLRADKATAAEQGAADERGRGRRPRGYGATIDR